MPASLLTEMNTQNGGLEDQRALQIALELTKLGLSENERGSSMPSRSYQENTNSESRKSPSTSSSGMCAEDVEVPSADHVAEIVGRQGCKIKALRAKTNTYIKTPVRGEPSVFQVTGKKEDVAAAKREILSAAEHFTQIRASRSRNNHGPPSPGNHGQETIQVRVPYRVVGLVVGPKGATIKRIQQQTQTYIVTPSRDKEPIFEVTGLPDNVEKARQEILTHIAMRTGEGMVEGGSPSLTSLANVNIVRSRAIVGIEDQSDFHGTGLESEFRENDRMGSLFKPPSANSAFTQYANALNRSNSSQLAHLNQQDNIFTYPNGKMAPDMGGLSALASTTAGGFYDSSDEGIGSSPSFDGSTMMPLSGSSIWSDIGSGELSLAMPCSAATIVGCYTDTLSSPPAVISPADIARLDNLAGTRLVSSDRGRSQRNHYSLPSSQVSSNTRGSASTSPTDSTESLGNPRRPGFVTNDPTPW